MSTSPPVVQGPGGPAGSVEAAAESECRAVVLQVTSGSRMLVQRLTADPSAEHGLRLLGEPVSIELRGALVPGSGTVDSASARHRQRGRYDAARQQALAQMARQRVIDECAPLGEVDQIVTLRHAASAQWAWATSQRPVRVDLRLADGRELAAVLVQEGLALTPEGPDTVNDLFARHFDSPGRHSESGTDTGTDSSE